MTDYDLLSEPGIPRVSSISASQALRASSSLSSTPYPFPAAPLPTGLDRLDNALRAAPVTAPDHAASPSRPGQGPSSGGIPRGSITEIYGPPGVGKTAVSLNIAATALAAGENEKVVWIDTGSPIPRLRLKQLLTSRLTLQSNGSIDESLNECMSRFQHIRAPTLPHLLSLITHPPANFPGEGTTLLIIDSISALFQSYFPNATELRSRLQAQAQGHGHGQGTEHQQKQTTQWLLNRKWNVISDLANKMVKLATTTAGAAAATTNRPKMAIILLNQTHTKIKGQPRPTLYPAVGGAQAWENCVHTRIVLYRDWWSAGGSTTRAESSRVRYAEIMKRGGKIVSVRTDDNIFAFLIEDGGLRELHTTQQQQHPPSSIPRSTPIMRVRKRKVDEVADSEDDDVEDDDSEFANAIDDDFQWDNAVDAEVKDKENNS